MFNSSNWWVDIKDSLKWFRDIRKHTEKYEKKKHKNVIVRLIAATKNETWAALGTWWYKRRKILSKPLWLDIFCEMSVSKHQLTQPGAALKNRPPFNNPDDSQTSFHSSFSLYLISWIEFILLLFRASLPPLFSCITQITESSCHVQVCPAFPTSPANIHTFTLFSLSH